MLCKLYINASNLTEIVEKYKATINLNDSIQGPVIGRIE